VSGRGIDTKELKDLPWVSLDDVDIELQSDGYLRCSESGRPNWCKHIESTIKDRWDIPLWQHFMKLPDVALSVHVPVLPSIAVFVEVEFHSVTLGSSTAPAIELVVVDKRIKYVPPNDEGWIGYMNTGDSIATVREMLIMYLNEYRAKHKNQCRSSNHKLSAQREWEKNMKSAQMHSAEMVCVKVTGKCMFCQRGTSDDWSDDLIPDVGNNNSPWR
jgi:hypothetical protein